MSSSAVIVVTGFAAVGKTTLANRLAAYYALPVLSPDAVTGALRASKASRDVSYDFEWVAFDVLAALCRAQLANGVTVIVDAPMSDPGQWQQMRGVCHEFGARLLPLVLECPLEVSAERAKSPNAVDEYRTTCERLGSLDFPHHRVDGTENANSVFSAAVTIIDAALDKWEPAHCGAPEEGQ